MTKDDATYLLQLCGAAVVGSPDAFSGISSSKCVIISLLLDTNDTLYRKYKVLKEKYEVPVIKAEWMIDCITTYTSKPSQKYSFYDLRESSTDEKQNASTSKEGDMTDTVLDLVSQSKPSGSRFDDNREEGCDQIYKEHIRNLGNHEHNIQVHHHEKTDLVVRKRPVDNKVIKHTIHDYVPCSNCLGYTDDPCQYFLYFQKLRK